MVLNTLGDARQHFLTGQASFRIKSELNTLVQELSTGQVSDLTAHLGADQSRLTGIDRQITLLDQFNRSNTQTGQMLSTMQLALNAVENQRATQSVSLMTVGSDANLPQIETAAKASEAAFGAVVQALNTRQADRSLFAGAAVDRNPLASPEILMDSLRTAVAGLSTASDIESAIAGWFDTPGGGFETAGFQGNSTIAVTRNIGPEQSVPIEATADDPAFRETLKALALGAIAGDANLAADIEVRRDIQGRAGEALLTAASPLSAIQARLGHAEQQVEEARAENSAKRTALGIARNDLVTADPFETATRLQQVQQQLETQYTLTARLSRLTLTEYLR